MTRLVLLLSILSACVVQDALVNEPSSAAECCLLWPATDDVVACFERFVVPGVPCRSLVCEGTGYETPVVCPAAAE